MKKRRTSGTSGTGKGFAETGQNISWTRRSTTSSSFIVVVDDADNGWRLSQPPLLNPLGNPVRANSLLYLSRASAIRHIVSTPSFLASWRSRGVSLRTNAAYPGDSHLDTSYWTPSIILSTGSMRGWKIVNSSIARVRGLVILKRDDIDRIDFHDSRDGLKVVFILKCRDVRHG